MVPQVRMSRAPPIATVWFGNIQSHVRQFWEIGDSDVYLQIKSNEDHPVRYIWLP